MTQNELKNQLALYTSGKLGMSEFRDWFGPVFRAAHKHGADVETLAHAVEWGFVDFERRLVPSEASLKENLSRLLTVDTAMVANPPEPKNAAVAVERQEVVVVQTKGRVLAASAAGNSPSTLVVVQQEPVVRNEPSFTFIPTPTPA